MNRSVLALPLSFGLVLLMGCGGDNTYSPVTKGGGGGTPPVIGISIQSPNPPQCFELGTLQYSATVTGTDATKVDWSVVTDGGGSISNTGLYQAPDSPGTYTIMATVDADKSVFATATATVVAKPAITISIQSPNPAQCDTGGTLQYAATVTGSSDTKVLWTVVSSNGGAISSSGLYQAPNTPGTYTIKATADADHTVYATATATVVTGTGSLGGTIQ